MGPVVVVAVSTIASAALLIRLNRSLWFFGDDWDFLLRRGSTPGGLGLLEPHNEHWSTIPILLYRALFALFGLAHYLPYVLPVIAAHLAAVALLYALLVRLGADRWVAAVVATMLAFLGSGSENLMWAFQIGFVGSVFFGLAALLLYDRAELAGWRVGFVWLACLLSLMCSGVGITMVVLVAAYALSREGLRRALVVASVPALVYLLWYAGWGRLAARAATPDPTDYLKVPEYVWTGLTSTWDRNVGITGAGFVVVAVLVGATLMLRGHRLAQLARAGMLAALVQLTLSGASRIGLGVEQATASRYSYLVTVLMLPAVVLLFTTVVARWRRPDAVAVVVLAALAAMVVINGVRLELSFAHDRRGLVAGLPQRLAAAVDLVDLGAPLLRSAVEPTYNPDITVDALNSPEVRRSLPHVPVTAQDLLNAAGVLQVAVAPAPSLPALTTTIGSTNAAVPALVSGCREYRAAQAPLVLELSPSSTGGQVRVVTTASSIVTQLRSGSLTTPVTTWQVTPGTPVYVATSAAAGMVVTLPGVAAAQVCTGE